VKVIVFGDGWLGNLFAEKMKGQVVGVDILDFDAVKRAVYDHKPDVVINAVGKTGRPNIDWCEESEDNKRLTRYSNDYAISILREVVVPCAKLVHLSSGCLWEWGEDYSEMVDPDPPSFYSKTKADGEKRLRLTDALIVRIRMPFDGSGSPRCLLSKLLKYKTMISYPNSLTYVPDLIDAVEHLVELQESGVFNVVNTGAVSAREIISAYRTIHTCDMEREFITIEELASRGLIRTGWSNTILSNEKLLRTGFEMPKARDRISECLSRQILLPIS